MRIKCNLDGLMKIIDKKMYVYYSEFNLNISLVWKGYTSFYYGGLAAECATHVYIAEYISHHRICSFSARTSRNVGIRKHLSAKRSLFEDVQSLKQPISSLYSCLWAFASL